DNKLKWQQEGTSSLRTAAPRKDYAAVARRSDLSRGSRRRCDRTVWWCVGFRAPRCLRVLDRAAGFEIRASRSCQESARRERVDPNYAQIRQQIIVVGDQRPFRRCAQRCEFSIVPIPDENKGARIDGAGKLPFWLEEISDFLPVEAPNSAQD